MAKGSKQPKQPVKKEPKPSVKDLSKPSVQELSKPLVQEESGVSVKEEFTVPVSEGKGIIDFYYFFVGLGILITIVFIIVGILRYLHIL